MQALDSFTFLSTVSVSGDGYVFDLVKLIGFLGLLGAGAYFLTDFAKKRRVQSSPRTYCRILLSHLFMRSSTKLAGK